MVVPLCLGPRDCGLVGQKGPGPLGEGSIAARQRAAMRGGAAQIPKGAEASRVDPETGPVTRPHIGGRLRDRLGEWLKRWARRYSAARSSGMPARKRCVLEAVPVLHAASWQPAKGRVEA
jgi:hypothetical protein